MANPPRGPSARVGQPVLALMTVLALIGTACSGGGGEVPVAADDRLGGLVALMSDDPEETGSLVRFGDNESLWDDLGLTPPPPGDTVEASAEFLEVFNTEASETYGSGLPSTLPPSLAQRSARIIGREAWVRNVRDTIGVDPTQVAAWAEWGDPPDTVIVMVGDFDPEAVEAAAHTNEWPGEMTEHTHRGITYWSWLDDFDTDRTGNPPLNFLGGSQRLAVVDGDTLIITRATSTMERMIDRRVFRDALSGNEGLMALHEAVGRQEVAWPPWFIVAGGLDSGSYGVATSHVPGPEGASSDDQSEDGLADDELVTARLIVAPARSHGVADLRAELDAVVDAALADPEHQDLFDVVKVAEDGGVVVVSLEFEPTDVSRSEERVAHFHAALTSAVLGGGTMDFVEE